MVDGERIERGGPLMYRRMGLIPQSLVDGGSSADRTPRSRHAASGAAVLAAALIATACTTVTDGAAHRSEGGPAPGTVDVSLLDTGNYPTRPAPPLGAAGTPELGKQVEGVRMAEHVVGPWEVDPALTESGRADLLSTPDALIPILTRNIARAAGQHNYVTGFSSARKTESGRVDLVNAVMRFADPASAAAAAAECADLAVQPGIIDGLPTAQPATIPNHPDTRASTYETPAPGSTTPNTSVSAYTAHGPYVLFQYAGSPDGVVPAADRIAKTLDLQVPAIDTFVPTPVSELGGLPLDDGGLLARTVPASGDGIPPLMNHVYGRQATLHFEASPLSSEQLFTDTGMDLWAWGKATVYQVRDGEAAAKLFERLMSDSQDNGEKPMAPVPDMPDSRCFEHEQLLSNKFVVCSAVADRYVIQAGSAQIADAHQQTAAQYAMLMAS